MDTNSDITNLLDDLAMTCDGLLALQLSELAVQLAQQAGEEVQRPLSEAQIARAFAVMRAERNLMAAQFRQMLAAKDE